MQLGAQHMPGCSGIRVPSVRGKALFPLAPTPLGHLHLAGLCGDGIPEALDQIEFALVPLILWYHVPKLRLGT